MGFIDSLLAWLVLFLIIAFIFFAVFAYFLGWGYPNEVTLAAHDTNLTNLEEETNKGTLAAHETNLAKIEEETTYRRRWIGFFVLFALIIIMGSTGLNAFLNTKS